jgi:CHASE2 domain-containing sensor protein
MAKSRKRRKRRAGPGPRPKAGASKQRAPVEPAVRRTARDERPRAPWGSFPLTELTVLVGVVMLVIGFTSQSFAGTVMIVIGITLGALGGLELAIREHFAGYRSHSGLLALACAVLTAGVLTALAVAVFGSVIPAIPVAAGAVAFLPAFVALRKAFRRASGGLSFRIGRLKG